MLKSRGIPVVCEAVDLDGEHRGGKRDVDQVVALRREAVRPPIEPHPADRAHPLIEPTR